ncbi:MAG: AP2 domain-containing protein [Candidatus Cloacimonetes bacterium]|nr:AP2 domain-containing protein [Candidatus Cloacimonadota bacterium]
MNKTITKPILIQDLGMIYPKESSKHKRHYGVYQCQCGNEFKTQTYDVQKGKTSSCGCYHKQRTAESHIIHGLSNHRLYLIWCSIKSRCGNPKNKRFKDYGGRGITICNEWRDDFETFYTWAIANGYKKGLTIDRINNDGNYEPSNCRWTTSIVQSRNTRKIRECNTSGYRGVSFHKMSKKWVAQININYNRKHIGSFKTSLDAAKAYDKYVIDNNLEHTINFKGE